MKTKETKQQVKKEQMAYILKRSEAFGWTFGLTLLGFAIGVCLCFFNPLWLPKALKAYWALLAISNVTTIGFLTGFFLAWIKEDSPEERVKNLKKRLDSKIAEKDEIKIPENKEDYSAEDIKNLKKIHRLETKIQRLEVEIEISEMAV